MCAFQIHGTVPAYIQEDMPEKQLQLFIYLNNLECSQKRPHCFSVVQKRAIRIWQPKSWSLTFQPAFMLHSLHSGWGLQVWNLPWKTGMLIEMSGRTDGNSSLLLETKKGSMKFRGFFQFSKHLFTGKASCMKYSSIGLSEEWWMSIDLLVCVW